MLETFDNRIYYVYILVMIICTIKVTEGMVEVIQI